MTREEAIEVIKAKADYLESDKRFRAAVETIIPELAESEDERIREDLIGGLMWQRDNLGHLGKHDDSLILPGFCRTVGEHLAYLEKQKEQKPAEVDESTKRLNENWMKQYFDEQKPAEVCYGPKGDPDPAGVQLDEIGKLIFRYFRKVLASFGVYAEDEALPEPKKGTLCYYSQQCADAILKSLRPQPKVELSEEDEKELDCIINVLDRLGFEEFRKSSRDQDVEEERLYYKEIQCLKKLKSLRPPWKPSEEHLSALLAVFNDPNNIGSQTCQLALTDLYEQLKKL